MGSPRISVVMAVYNSGRWLEESLASVLGQSLGNFEFIVIDDCSTDGSAAILERAARGDNRIVVLKNERNLGLTASLNLGIEVARGEYLARMDADDISLPGRFAEQVEFQDRHPEVGVLGGGIRVIDESGHALAERLPPLEDESVRAELTIKNNAFAHSTVLARTELLRKAGGYDEAFRYAQDYDLWQRLGASTRFACLPRLIVEWRTTPDSISRLRRPEQLDCQYRVSLRGLSEHLGGELDTDSYRRFWFALHGETAPLGISDLERLGPLWGFLERQASLMPRTLESLSGLALALLRQGRRPEAARLLEIVARQLGARVGWKARLRSRLSALFSAPRTESS